MAQGMNVNNILSKIHTSFEVLLPLLFPTGTFTQREEYYLLLGYKRR